MEEVNGILSEAKQAAVENEALLKSKKALSLIAHKSENAKFNQSKVPYLRNIIRPDFTPMPIPSDLLENIMFSHRVKRSLHNDLLNNYQVQCSCCITHQPNDNQEATVGAFTDIERSTFFTSYKQL